MIKKSIKPDKLKSITLIKVFLWCLVGIVLFSTDIFAQNYEFTLKQRRMGNQIGVEVWVKSLSSSAANLGDMTIAVKYDPTFLLPATLVAGTNPTKTSDSISLDMEQTTPVTTLSSAFADALYGYGDLSAQALDNTVNYFFKLEVNKAVGGGVGFQPLLTGRGSYVGMLKFDIRNYGTITNTSTTGVGMNASAVFAANAITDINGNNVTSSCTFTEPASFTVRGITLWNPNGPNQTVNRYPLAALSVLNPNLGYPIYFERSGLISSAAKYGVSNNLAYSFQYSLDNGSSWAEIGSAVETSAAGTSTTVATGELDFPSAANERYLTKVDGTALTASYGGVIRGIWKANANFPYRSEVAKLRVRQLDTTGVAATVASRAAYDLAVTSRWDMSDNNFVLGRLMFVQLDGTCTYFKTTRPFSNATQLTVEAWVNLNSIQSAAGAEPGIVVSSAGSASPEEGAWMLYLKDGMYPAFRAREIAGRGPGGYIGTVVSPFALTAYSDAAPLTTPHSKNWVHLAATVENNLIKLFVNGEEVGRYLNTQEVNIRMLTTDHPIWIGVNPNISLAPQNYLHAGIKEVKVWRNALTVAQLRNHLSGVNQPTDMTYGDERTALELYYPLQASRTDFASIFYEQNALTPVNYYSSCLFGNTAVNTLINYRPDRAHIKLTSPVGGEGVSNLRNSTYPVRWAAYGIGSTAPNSSDLQIMASRDGGLTWFDAIDNQIPSMPMDTMEVEQGEASWAPYNNATIWGQSDDLQGIIDVESNYAKSTILKISGTAVRGQEEFSDTSASFVVAPYFAFMNPGTAQIKVNDNTDLNLSSAKNVVEAWIRPYRFPSVSEGYFPIVAKKSADGANLNYSLRLLPTGQLQYLVTSSTGTTLRTATSSAHADSVLKAPNVVESDTSWTHVAVYTNIANGGSSTVVFYIDGTPQWIGALPEQLGSNITLDATNTYPVYIGYEPGTTLADNRYFIGAMKEVRFWNGDPGNQTATSNYETSNLSYFIQGAATIRANELGVFNGNDYSTNLVAAYIMNGGSWTNGGIKNSISSYPVNENLAANVSGTAFAYESTKPLVKVIAPTYKQRAANTKTDLKVRWTGFDYNRNNLTSFRNGSDATNHADMEFSYNGGGNTAMLPYQYVADQVYSAAYSNAMTLYTSQANFEFPGTTTKSQFAAELNLSITDPDLNNDSTFSDQGPIAAANSNARLRLKGRSTINGYTLEYNNGANGIYGAVNSLRGESKLFTVTPPSNFTVRVLLEGYHKGTASGIVANLGTTGSATGGTGLTINLYANNANLPGAAIVATSESNSGTAGGYNNSTTALTYGSTDFANVPFVFDQMADGRYFVKVDHINHLSVMSRWAAPFYFAGDDALTNAIESGWDFSKWGGVADNTLLLSEAQTNPPTYGSKYAAFGNAATDPSNTLYGTTALVYNNGQAGGASNQIAAMIGGDVFKDGAINALDKTRVVTDNGTTLARSDVSGDGFVNATDRTITYRNSGMEADTRMPVGKIGTKDADVTIPMIREFKEIDQLHPELSLIYIEAEREMKKHQTSKEVEVVTPSLQGGLDYKVMATPYLNGSFIEVPMYIENVGANWAPANCTFGINYEPAYLKFEEMYNANNVIFSERSDLGYYVNKTSPDMDAKDPISDLRTIDIDFENHRDAHKRGIAVPYTPTYLGTLKFRIISAKDAYFFKWNPITVVYSVDNGDVTSDGKFLPIVPLVISKPLTVVYPNGGENLSAGRPYSIAWTKPSDASLMGNIDFSTDNGASWTRITSAPISLASATYNWTAPRVTSTECLIAIVNASNNTIIDKSDAPFAITSSPAVITRPATTDPVYKGGVADVIKWEIDQNVKVKFEFSENGSSNWISVSPTVNSKSNQTNWVLPVANTKLAVVRMINADNGEVLAVSTPFRVLAGSVDLISPRDGDKLKFGTKKPVRWNYDNVNTFDLQLSINGGQSWTMMSNDIKAVAKTWDWMVPNVSTKNAIVRAIYNGDEDLVYDTTPLFEIIGNGVDVENPELYGFKLETAVPNPFRTETKVSFTVPSEEYVTISVYSSNGVEVAKLAANELFGAGTHSLIFKARELSSGMYLIRMNTGMFTLTQEVVLVK